MYAVLVNCDPGYGVVTCHKLLESIAGRGLHGMDALIVALRRIASLYLICETCPCTMSWPRPVAPS